MGWKHVLAELSRLDIGERKFDGTVRQKLGDGKWKKKIGDLAFQKVAKTGNIGNQRTIGPVSLTWVLRICRIRTNLEIY